MGFDQQYGWNEATAPSTPGDLSSPTQVVAAKAGYQILIRRIRGTGTGNRCELRSATNALVPRFEANSNFDIPGLELRCNTGEALNVINLIGTDPTQITVQYAYIPGVAHPQMGQVT